MTEPKKLTARECAKAILAIEKPLVVSHQRPDGDAVGSAVALVRTLRALGRDARFICSDPVPKRLSFLVKDEWADNTNGFTPIAIDVASESQLGPLKEKIAPVALVIDHHASNTPFADHYTAPEASSAAEALMDVIEILESDGLMSLSLDIATPLYGAISSDTGCFCYSNASSKTHIRAARLLSLGVNAADVNHRLFNTKTKSRLRADGYIAENLMTASDGRIAYATLTYDRMAELSLTSEDFECAIDVIRSLEGAEVAMFLRQIGEGEYKASLRSVGKNVADIAARFGGGGHIRAAGCSVKADSIEEALRTIIVPCEELFK